MHLERLVAGLSRVFVVLMILTIAYVTASIVLAIGAHIGLPDWPLFALVVGMVTVIAVYSVSVIVQRSAKRKLVATLSAEAERWPGTDRARVAARTGDRLTRIDGLRARARAPRVVEVSWNPPLDAVEEVHVYRSARGFATAPESVADQVLLCRDAETSHVDTDLDDERVYFYTAFARRRDGGWSSPSWTWVATPSLPLHTRFLAALRLARIGMFDGSG